jgi:hypothetical protein
MTNFSAHPMFDIFEKQLTEVVHGLRNMISINGFIREHSIHALTSSESFYFGVALKNRAEAHGLVVARRGRYGNCVTKRPQVTMSIPFA